MERARYIFDTIQSAAEGLETVLLDARKTKFSYKFSGVSADQILKSGLILEGEISALNEKLDKLAGAAKFVE